MLCKSSWAFSAAGALEAQYRKVWGRLIALSEQQLIDCSKTIGNKGCDGGTVQNAFRYVNQAGGICDENSYSYLGYVRLLNVIHMYLYTSTFTFWTCVCVCLCVFLHLTIPPKQPKLICGLTGGTVHLSSSLKQSTLKNWLKM